MPLILSIAFSLIAGIVWVIVVIVAVIQRRSLRTLWKPGALLAGAIGLLTLPAHLVIVLFLDLSAAIGQPVPAWFSALTQVLAGVLVVALVLVASGHHLLKILVIRTIGPRDRPPFPLLLGDPGRFQGWPVAVAWGAGAAGVSIAAFDLLEVELSQTIEKSLALAPGLDELSLAATLAYTVPLVIGAALAEELLFRGVMQRGLTRILGGTTGGAVGSVLAVSLVFALGHAINTDPMWPKLVQIFLISLGFGALSRRYSVEASMIAHVCLNLFAVVGATLSQAFARGG